METLERTSDDVGTELQGVLVELLDLSLQGKQVHWNLTGTTFLALHPHLDDLVAEYRSWSDRVAERAVAIGTWPDGGAGAISARSGLRELPSGPIPDGKALRLLSERIEHVVERLRERIEAVGTTDPASENLLVEILTGLEEQRWMLRAAMADPGSSG